MTVDTNIIINVVTGGCMVPISESNPNPNNPNETMPTKLRKYGLVPPKAVQTEISAVITLKNARAIAHMLNSKCFRTSMPIGRLKQTRNVADIMWRSEN